MDFIARKINRGSGKKLSSKKARGSSSSSSSQLLISLMENCCDDMLRPFQASLSFNRVFISCDREINRSFSSKRIGSINFVKVEFEKIFDNLIVDNRAG